MKRLRTSTAQFYAQVKDQHAVVRRQNALSAV